MNHLTLKALLADPTAWTLVDAPSRAVATAAPAAEIGIGMVAPAWAAEVA
jgi:UDP-3-O-[3-hydroxymyristoyl] N-acetylglucosamine deacetylase